MNTIRVGSAAVVEDSRGRILLTKRNKEPMKGYWVLPGGGVKFGETIEDTVKREIKEETGLDIELTSFITVYQIIKPKENQHRVIIYHKARLKGGQPRPSDDTSEIKWVYPENAKSVEKIASSTLDVLRIGNCI